ncbi:MAG: CapA family protein [Candidatus Paceibacterota bacterium]|jgi:poly-gamma-glutamate synthesis protein (capsule biosynthesis protein)
MKKYWFFIGLLIVLFIGTIYLNWNFLNKFLIFEQTPNISLIEDQNMLSPKASEVSLIAVGDIMLTRGVKTKIVKNGSDYPFLKIKDYLKSGDIVFGNLETPIASGRAILPGEMLFRSDPGLEKQLKESNFSILSLANNHTGNFGTFGFEQTFKYLNEVGIKYVGAGQNKQEAYSPVWLKVNGITFAFLAYDDIDFTPATYEASDQSAGIAFMHQANLEEAITSAKKQADFVIVSMHSGDEYKDFPNQEQIDFAHAAIDFGAELVIGHHPHVIEPIEQYKGKYIFYSLGNFIFDQMWSLGTREGIATKITFDKNGIIKIENSAILIEDYCQPKIITGLEAENIFKRLYALIEN